MFNFIKKISNRNSFEKIAEKQLDKNISIIKSLKDYDEGKKDISTIDIEKRLPDIRLTPQA